MLAPAAAAVGSPPARWAEVGRSQRFVLNKQTFSVEHQLQAQLVDRQSWQLSSLEFLFLLRWFVLFWLVSTWRSSARGRCSPEGKLAAEQHSERFLHLPRVLLALEKGYFAVQKVSVRLARPDGQLDDCMIYMFGRGNRLLVFAQRERESIDNNNKCWPDSPLPGSIWINLCLSISFGSGQLNPLAV